MKRPVKIVILNSVLLLVIMLSFEFFCAFKSLKMDMAENYDLTGRLKETARLALIHYTAPMEMNYKERMRAAVLNRDYNKKGAVILLGCSYTYGDGLKEEETFGAQLSEYAERNVINLGMCCASPREMLYILRNHHIRNKLIPKDVQNNTDYVIYTYISDQRRRLYSDVCRFLFIPCYTPDRDFKHLIYKEKSRFAARSFAVNFIKNAYYFKWAEPSGKASKLLNLYFKEIKREIQYHFKNKEGKTPEIVLLLYEDYNGIDREELINEGFQILDTKFLVKENLMSKEYMNKTWHPKKEAWQLLAPVIAQKLNL